MRYLKVVYTYSCPKGHPNELIKHYSVEGVLPPPEKLESLFPKPMLCSVCPPGTVFSGRSGIGMGVHILTEEQFKSLGVTAEPVA